MESIIEVKDEVKRLCRICGLEGEFEAKRQQCRKCMSKKRYELNKKKNYYNNYYDQHKDIVLKCQHEYYIRKRDKKKETESTTESTTETQN